MVTLTSKISRSGAQELPDRVWLSGISWETYENLRDDLERSGRRLKLTYDDGELEIEVPGKIHEAVKTIVRMMLEAYLLEREIWFEPLSATLWRDRLRSKGLEADESYYFIRHKDRPATAPVDADGDPIPDMAIEVEITSPLLPKLPVYAALGVAEIWHLRTESEVDILELFDGKYRSVPRSRFVPEFTPELLKRYASLRIQNEDTLATLMQFRQDVLAKG